MNDYARKSDYVSSASLTSQLNNLKSQHIAIEVTGIDNKTKKNANDILAVKNELEKKEYDITENEIGISFNRGFFYYLQQSNLVYECKIDCLFLIIKIYQSGGQQVFLISQIIIV